MIAVALGLLLIGIPADPEPYNLARVLRVVEAKAETKASVSSGSDGSSFPSSWDPTTYAIVGGVSATNQQSSTQATPYVDVLADFPFVIGGKGLKPPHAPIRMQLEAIFQGLPGKSVTLQDPATYSSVRFQGSVHFPIGVSPLARTTISLGGGVASRFGGRADPLIKNPGHGEVCIGVYRKDHSASFTFCPIGFSNETGDPATVARADGRITIQGAMRLQVETIVPYANAPSNYWNLNQVHSVTTTVAVGFDLDHLLGKP